MRQDEDRLNDIIDAIDAIKSKIGPDRSSFDNESMLRVWCLHHITIIGEAASKISPDLREKHPSIPWRNIVGMRNAIVHGYFDVDWDTVWTVVENDLEPLKNGIENALTEEQGR